jgi:hypothetical protein
LLLFSWSCSSKATETSVAQVESLANKVPLSQLKAGEAKGILTYKGISIELKYAYARKVKVSGGGEAYSLLLTDQPFSEDVLKKGDTLDNAIGLKNNLHFMITIEGKIALRSFYLQWPNGSRSDSILFASSERKSFRMGVDSIEGELS